MSRISINACETHSDGLLMAIVGMSYYHIGNYSDAQTWLKCALLIVNKDLKDENLRDNRLYVCFYLLMSGNYFNVFCYGYIIKDLTILFSTSTVKNIHEDYITYTQPLTKQQPAAETVIWSTETSVTEKKYSFVWSQFNQLIDEFQCAIDKKVSTAEKIVSQFPFYNYLVYCVYVCSCVICCSIPFLILCAVYICIVIFIRCLLSVCCTKQQIVYCCTIHKFIAIAFIVTTLLFVLGLDWLY